MDPSDGRAYVVLGRIMLKQRRFEEARQLYSEGCYNTGNANPYIWAAWGYLEARCGKPDIARKMYDAAVCVDPAHACAWHKWGMLEKAEGNYTRARDRWLQGIQNCRKTAQKSVVYLYQSLAVMAAELGKVDQARAWFEEGTRTAFGPSSVALWQAWAVMEARQGDKSAVRYLFKRALQAEPRSRYVHLAWAMWEQEQGNMRQCLALLRRGQQFNPTDPALYQAWAVLEKQTGNVDRARQLFEAGLRANKSHLPLWQAWGVMEFEIGNVDRARELFQQGVWADAGSKDCAYAFHAWGVLERSAGNHGLARELFKSALKVRVQCCSTGSR